MDFSFEFFLLIVPSLSWEMIEFFIVESVREKEGDQFRTSPLSASGPSGLRLLASRNSCSRQVSDRDPLDRTCSDGKAYVCHVSEIQTGWSPHSERSFER
jgi:hypothetical protein